MAVSLRRNVGGRATKDLSNPVCSPRFRVSASRYAQQTAFAFGVPPCIYGFYPYTQNSICLCILLRVVVSRTGSKLSLEIESSTYRTAYTRFTPNDAG